MARMKMIKTLNGPAFQRFRKDDTVPFRDCVDLDVPGEGMPWYIRIRSPETLAVRDAYTFVATGELEEADGLVIESGAYHALSQRTVRVLHPFNANRNLENGWELAPEAGR
jgi:hypothetical protein